ncbi:flagellar hook-associated protein FlgL [Hydrogenophaga sp.]|uniref:flagellar hook-associated protein FlgL n=1 Tax=Hydrogenophaga sp. TaxID=1904254 RepID=UPI0035674720
MRIATANSYDNTISMLTKRQAELSAQQERLSTGKRVIRASDDPVAATLAEGAQNRMGRVQADMRALESSRTSLAQAESGLAESGELLQKTRELLVSASNATYSASDRKTMADQIEGLRDQMLAVANRQDTEGRTLFGGLGGSTQPFVDLYGPSGTGVQFNGQRGQSAAGNVSLPQSFDGEAIWMRLPQGNGSFSLDLPSSNTGGVRTSSGQVSDASLLTGHDYSVAFASVGGALQYTVTDLSTGTPVAGQTGVPYEAGKTIGFDGLSFEMKGQPAAGDSIELRPVTGVTDIFKVMQDAIDTLRGSQSDASRNQALSRTLGELDSGLDRVLSARGRAGEWLNRAESLDSSLKNRSVALENEKSQLEDLDMVQGISDFQNQQTALEAALKSYAQVQRLSLFQYLG